ncbi:MAG: PilZ domain-containing protein [Methyloprofundus sp.]|nr:PilZ domain-containing protein [Methyloprofundus sp.]
MTEDNDKRHFHRCFYKKSATLSLGDQQWDCELVDISIHGCLLRFNETWASQDLDSIYTLNLELSEEKSITMSLSISHAIDNEIGCKCEHIDLDSISELRRLVELNLGNSDFLERDLQALSH